MAEIKAMGGTTTSRRRTDPEDLMIDKTVKGSSSLSGSGIVRRPACGHPNQRPDSFRIRSAAPASPALVRLQRRLFAAQENCAASCAAAGSTSRSASPTQNESRSSTLQSRAACSKQARFGFRHEQTERTGQRFAVQVRAVVERVDARAFRASISLSLRCTAARSSSLIAARDRALIGDNEQKNPPPSASSAPANARRMRICSDGQVVRILDDRPVASRKTAFGAGSQQAFHFLSATPRPCTPEDGEQRHVSRCPRGGAWTASEGWLGFSLLNRSRPGRSSSKSALASPQPRSGAAASGRPQGLPTPRRSGWRGSAPVLAQNFAVALGSGRNQIVPGWDGMYSAT